MRNILMKKHIKVNETGPTVSQLEVDNLIQSVKDQLKKGDWWVLGGSIPNGVDPSIYAKLIKLIEQAGAFSILDTSGEALRLGCDANPTLAKPNLEEAQELLNLTDDQVKNPSNCFNQNKHKGPKNLVVSLGKEGALLIADQKCIKEASATIIEKNPTGAGDSMVAGLVYKLSNKQSLQQALQFGLACGAATASKAGTDLGSLEEVNILLAQL